MAPGTCRISTHAADSLKSLHIFRARGSRAGQAVKRRIHNIAVINNVPATYSCHYVPVRHQYTSHSTLQPKTVTHLSKTLDRLPVVAEQPKRILIPVQRQLTRIPRNNLPRFLYGNCRSIIGKLQSLTSLCKSHSADVICLCETWLNNFNVFILESEFIDFIPYHCCRVDKVGGGLSILVSNKYESQQIDSLCNPDIELLAVNITCSDYSSTSLTHLVVCVYRPPSGSVEAFKVTLDQFLTNRPYTQFTTVIGDFNRSSTLTFELLHGLSARIQFKTRGDATLDQLLSDVKSYQEPTRIEPIGSSDHVTIGFFPQKHCKTTVTKRLLIPDKRAQFISAAETSLFNANWSNVYLSREVDQAERELHKILTESLSAIPQRKVELTNRDPPWKTPIIKDMERRRTLAFKKNRTDEVKQLTVDIDRETCQAKKTHVKKLKSGSKEWWKNVTKTLKPTSGNLEPFVKLYNSDKEAADSYNINLVQRFPVVYNLQGQQLPTNIGSEAPYISLHEVILGIRALRNGSACGPDKVPSWFLKKFEIHLAEPLTALFNLSLQTGVFPSSWKHATITPLPKVKSPKSVNDLRPISLTSIIGKIFERIVLKLIGTHWHAIMNKDQFAYRPQSSTTCALTAIQHHWLSTLDRNAKCNIRVITIDFSKAFDSIEHSLLLGKIASLGFDHWFIKWFHSFLTGRTQCVRINDSVSLSLAIGRGIPQGTVLGPFAFVIFTNDLQPLDTERMTVVKYADDQTWSYVIKQGEEDNSKTELEMIELWCKSNCMLINEKKTFEMIISNVKHISAPAPSYINGVQLQRVENMKILGLTLSRDLRWGAEIEEKINKAKRLVYALRHLSFTHPVSDISQLFHSVFLPSILYCCQAWCNANEGQINQLQAICNRVCYITHSKIDIRSVIHSNILDLFVKSLDPIHPLNYITSSCNKSRENARRPRLLSEKANSTRYLNSFLPTAIRCYNKR